MTEQLIYIIDFDSTFSKVEALDELAEIVLEGHQDKAYIKHQVEDITKKAMDGELNFDLALTQRLALLPIYTYHLEQLIEQLKTKVSESVLRNKAFFKANAHAIYIVSGGFREFIVPVVATFSIPAKQVFANDFLFNGEGKVMGFNPENVLSQPKGKVKLLRSLQLAAKVIVIGDGYTDYEIREAGLADAFYLFTENISRTNLIDKADRILHSFDELRTN